MPAAMPTVSPVFVLFVLVLLASILGSWIWLVLRIAFQAPVLPRREPRIVPWNWMSVAVVVSAWLAIMVVVQYAFHYALHGTFVPPKGTKVPFSPAEMMVASAIQNSVILVMIPLQLAVLSGARLRDLGLTGPGRGRLALQGMVAWPLAAPLIYGMMMVAVLIWGKQNHPLEDAIQAEGIGRLAPLFFLAGVILAPAAEELIFRGVLLGWLTRLVLRAARDESPAATEAGKPVLAWDDLDDPAGESDHAPDSLLVPDDALAGDSFAPAAKPLPMPTRPEMILLAAANVGVSILFAALHASVWPTPVPIFFLSLVLGWLYQRTGSLVAPVALHMTFNGVSTVLMFVAVATGTKVDAPKSPDPLPIPAPAPTPTPLPKLAAPPVPADAGR